jgi:apolipoprotein N-acyltransferase
VALLPCLIALAREPRAFARPGPFRAVAIGLTTGVTYFAGTLYWIPDVLVTYGGLVRPLAIGAGALLIAYLALFPAVFSMMVAYARRRLGPEALLVAPAIWVATELARGNLLTGFPWALLGSSQVSVVPVAQAASVVGVYGLSAIVVWPAGTIAYAYHRRGAARWAALASTVVLLVGVTVWGHTRVTATVLTREGVPLTVGIAQGNIAQNTKWNPDYAERILRTYLDLTRRIAERGVSLIVWPEASLPFFFERDPVRAEAVRALARETGAFLLIGGDQVERGQTSDAEARYYNSAFLLRPDGSVAGTYRKVRLVPFGEYVPLKSILFFLGPIIEAAGDFYPGERVEMLPVDNGRLSTGICYEVIFPGLARAAVLAGSQLLTTMTNDAWYGLSSAPYQHFEQARMRAIEQGRYLVRSANTGISGVIDPYGRVLVKTELFEPAIASAEVRLLEPLTLYARIGDACAYACVALTVLVLGMSRLRR